MNRNVDYKSLCSGLRALIEGVPYEIANLANAAALLWQELPDINWAGFYRMEQEDALILGPFQGKPACIRIPVGKGVCGTAVEQDRVQMVANVHDFPGHIACDGASMSEIVIPLHAGGKIWGVLDIDSPYEGRFTECDRAGLSEFGTILEEILGENG